jgi:hypothetical protein
MLSLSHECEKFEFSGETSLHSLKSELYLGNLLAEVAEVLVLTLPGQGNIIIPHEI